MFGEGSLIYAAVASGGAAAIVIKLLELIFTRHKPKLETGESLSQREERYRTAISARLETVEEQLGLERERSRDCEARYTRLIRFCNDLVLKLRENGIPAPSFDTINHPQTQGD